VEERLVGVGDIDFLTYLVFLFVHVLEFRLPEVVSVAVLVGNFSDGGGCCIVYGALYGVSGAVDGVAGFPLTDGVRIRLEDLS
jgi:hypothetical protein